MRLGSATSDQEDRDRLSASEQIWTARLRLLSPDKFLPDQRQLGARHPLKKDQSLSTVVDSENVVERDQQALGRCLGPRDAEQVTQGPTYSRRLNPSTKPRSLFARTWSEWHLRRDDLPARHK